MGIEDQKQVWVDVWSYLKLIDDLTLPYAPLQEW